MSSADAFVSRMRTREQDVYLSETVTLRRKTSVTGPGGTSETWVDNGTVDGRVDPVGGTPEERVIADQIQAEQAVTITVPHGTDVTAADRVVVSGDTYEVVGVVAGSWVPNPKLVCRKVG